MLQDDLTEREKNVLRYIVQQFILTAAPVGSRNITRKYDLNFSAATVRNIMSDLEESGFINHPHTSAGRVPTDKGYRFYVDSLMALEDIPLQEKQTITAQIDAFQNQPDELFTLVSRLLSNITHQLACVMYPKLESGILEKLQIISVSSSRVLVVISIASGLVKTITLEINAEIRESQIQQVQTLLNERLAGLQLSEIRKTFSERMKDYAPDLHPILTVFFDSVDKIFTNTTIGDKAVISGASHLLKKPEFEDPERFQGVIELIEDKDIIIHVFDKRNDMKQNTVSVSIGTESEIPQLDDFSLISKEYQIGEVTGTLGVVGPKRMEYAKIVAIVNYVGELLTETLMKPS
jgi:heat-inducible transcriptional repressor